MWRGFKEFFTYNRKQRNGILLILLIAIGLQLYIYADEIWFKPPEIDQEYLKKFEPVASAEGNTKPQPSELFYFDPNTASASELGRLGMASNTVSAIVNYRDKGGQFRRKADLSKIYTLDSASYQRLEPYIKIETSFDEKWDKKYAEKELQLTKFDPNTASADELEQMGLKPWEVKGIISYREKVKPFTAKKELFKVYNLDSPLVNKMLPYLEIDTTLTALEDSSNFEVGVIDLATADTAQLKTVPGIGSAYAQRIVKFREELGGFHSVNQLIEIFGIDDSKLESLEPYLRLSNTEVKKLNLNTADLDTLSAHPYLNYYMARNIVNFRERVRAFKKTEELKHIELIDGEIFSKIAPYLTVTDDKTESHSK